MDDAGEKREEFYRIPHIIVDCIDANKWEDNLLKKENVEQLPDKEQEKISDIVNENLQIEDKSLEANAKESLQRKEKVPPMDTNRIASISDAKMFQLGKSKVAGKTLEEIGFVTSTRVVFTEHDAGVQADKKDVNIFLFQNQEISKETTSQKESEQEKTEPIIIGVREGYRETIPLYNISNRPLYQLNTDPVKIIPPTECPKEQHQGILRSMISPILMSLVMIVSRSSMTSDKISVMNLVYILMGVVTMGTTIYGHIDHKRIFAKSLNDWKTHYEKYIQRILYDIVEKQECDRKQLKVLYPSMLGLEEKQEMVVWDRKRKHSLVDMCAEIHPDIFTRGKEHPDFLSIRIGLSTEESQLVPSVFSIIGEKKDYIFTSEKYTNLGVDDKHPFTILLNDKGDAIIDDVKNEKQRMAMDEKKGRGYLIDLPAAVAKKYAYLKEAPVLLRLRECEILGIVLPKELSFYPILDNMIMNLSFYHSPDDVQMVFFCKKEDSNITYLNGAENTQNQWNYRQTLIDKYKHLPHFRELLGDISAFVYDDEAAGMVFNRLYEILSDKTTREDARAPHIILIFQEEYKFKRHAISEFLPEYSEKNENEQKNPNKLSFIFCKNYEEELPKYCGQVILAEKKSAV